MTPGPIPFDRHEAALRNARQEISQKFAWAEHLNPDEARMALDLLTRLKSDPRAFAAQLQREVADDTDEPMPEPDLVSEDGKHRAYSAALQQKIWDIREKKLMRQFNQQLNPLQTSEAQRQQQAEVQQIVARGTAVANQALADARQLPHFKDHEKAIGEKLAAIPKQTRDAVGSIAALYMAYNAVLTEQVFPTLAATTEQQVITDNKRKAAASVGGVQPGSNGAVKPAKPLRNQNDLEQYLRDKVAQGADL